MHACTVPRKLRGYLRLKTIYISSFCLTTGHTLYGVVTVFTASDDARRKMKTQRHAVYLVCRLPGPAMRALEARARAKKAGMLGLGRKVESL